MKFKGLLEALKYFDCFGTNFTFYTDKNRKFYTPFGGLLSLISIIVGIIVFICINIDDFSHRNPITTTSTVKEKEKNITFLEEKIWIPWRIRDYSGKVVDHTLFLFPIIYYYKGLRNEVNSTMELSYTTINYSLCNETSMKKFPNSYMIDTSLDKIYCIAMEELDMGGSFDIDFINFIEFDLYACRNGIDYDEKNPNCSTYETIMNISGSNNSFEIELYYPVVHYQPMNKTTPIFVRYEHYFYHLSRFSNKIDRLYLQQYILKDDNGWVFKKEKIQSHWGYVSLKGDSYAIGNKKDLMNEGSSSRFYSFNIYLKSDVVYYSRSYKKLFLIIADGLPIVNVIFMIFKLFTKIIKISSRNKKNTELLFENLQEKPNKIKNQRFNILNLNKKILNTDKMKFSPNPNNKINYNQNTTNHNINDLSLIQMNSQKDFGKKLLKEVKKRKLSLGSNDIKKNPKVSKKYSCNNMINKLSNNNINYGNVGVNNNINININNNIGDFINNKNNESCSMINISKTNIKSRNNTEDNHNNIIRNSLKANKKNDYYIKKKLFPYKYYLCSIFIKNIDISKKSIFFTRKFIVVYNFICQLFDVSSYVILQREFQILKNTLMLGKYRALLENRQKINVNDHSFNTDMKECIDAQKFSILGRIPKNKIHN